MFLQVLNKKNIVGYIYFQNANIHFKLEAENFVDSLTKLLCLQNPDVVRFVIKKRNKVDCEL